MVSSRFVGSIENTYVNGINARYNGAAPITANPLGLTLVVVSPL